MAITSESQIFNAQPAINAASLLDDVVTNLKAAKEKLLVAKKFCGRDAFETNEGNPYPDKIDGFVARIDAQITACQTLKTNVISKAAAIQESDRAEYQQYLKDQEEKRKQQESSTQSTAAVG